MADKLFELEIVTPQKTVFKGNAKAVTVPGTVSGFQILFNHAPIVSSLEMGVVRVESDDSTKLFTITSGFVENQKNVSSIIVEEAISADDKTKEEVEKENSELQQKLADSEDRAEKEIIKQKMKFNNILLKTIVSSN